jgi:iron complex transport system ATP-binding protein
MESAAHLGSIPLLGNTRLNFPGPPGNLRPMAEILRVTGLHLARVRAEILRGVDWCVRKGEHWAILGPNGCGKTSLLKSITGYMAPTSGEIALLGRKYGESDWRDLRILIGIVTSALQASIPPAETALETVVSGRYAQLDLWAHPTRKEMSEARKLLAFVGCSPLARREWAFLSQGERQRVLIARALMARPRLLILDEPCAGLDPVAREEFLRFLDATARRRGGPALVLVTHHAEEIMPAFTHALLMRDGRVSSSGPKPRVLTTRNLSVAFGAPISVRQSRGRYSASIQGSRI